MNEQKKFFSFGGGETKVLTCYEASDWFVKNVLTINLEKENVRFPEEKIRFGINPEIPKLPIQDLKDHGGKHLNKADFEKFGGFIGNYEGAECEEIVWDYLIKTQEEIKIRTAMFHNFDQYMFLRFTSDADKVEISRDDKDEVSGANKVKVSDADKVEISGADKVEISGADKVEISDADKVEISGADKVEVSDANKVEISGPDKLKVSGPKVEVSGAPKDIAPKAKVSGPDKTQASDASLTTKGKSNKPVKSQAPNASKASKGKANKTPKVKDPNKPDNKEIDFIFILAEYKMFCLVEVKAGFKGNTKWENQAVHGEHYFNKLIEFIGRDKYKDWTFLPVGVFPNSPDRNKVVCYYYVFYLVFKQFS